MEEPLDSHGAHARFLRSEPIPQEPREHAGVNDRQSDAGVCYEREAPNDDAPLREPDCSA